MVFIYLESNWFFFGLEVRHVEFLSMLLPHERCKRLPTFTSIYTRLMKRTVYIGGRCSISNINFSVSNIAYLNMDRNDV